MGEYCLVALIGLLHARAAVDSHLPEVDLVPNVLLLIRA